MKRSIFEMDLQQIFNDTDFVHTSGTKEELQVAGYLKMQCENMGVPAQIEGFRVAILKRFICMQMGKR